MKKLVLLFPIALFLASCSQGLRIEKRHYRSGYYIQKSSTSSRAETSAVPERDQPQVHFDLADREHDYQPSIAVGDSSEVITTKQECTVPETREIEQVILTGTILPNDTFAMPKKPVHLFADVPQETRTLDALSWISVALLGLGIIAAFVAFVPFASSALSVLITAAPFLILGALGLAIAVMVISKRRMLAAGSAAVGEHYARLRNRAKIVVWIAAGVIVLFVLFIALIIAALSKFQ